MIRTQPVLIDGSYPLHGPGATDGTGRRKATEMAIAEVNSQGGIAECPVVHAPIDPTSSIKHR